MTAKGCVAGAEGAAEDRPCNAAAHRPGPDRGRQTFHRAAGGGVDGGSDADFVDGGLKRGNLRGELSGGLAVVLVLDRQPGVGGRQIVERCGGTPASAEPDQDWKRERDDCGRDRRSQGEGEPADDPARSIRDDNRISSGRHGSPRPPPPGAAPTDFLERGTLPCAPRDGEVTKPWLSRPDTAGLRPGAPARCPRIRPDPQSSWRREARDRSLSRSARAS